MERLALGIPPDQGGYRAFRAVLPTARDRRGDDWTNERYLAGIADQRAEIAEARNTLAGGGEVGANHISGGVAVTFLPLAVRRSCASAPSLFAYSPRGGLVRHLARLLVGVAALSGSAVGCGETQPEHNWTGKGGSDLLRFVDSDGRTGILHARLERGEPVLEYELPGFGGGAYLIGVWCHGGAVDPRVEQYGEFEVLYGAAVDEAAFVRYARSTGDHAFLRTRRLPGLPLRWFAVHLRAGTVRSLNQVEAIGRGGLELGSPHYNRGDGTFPALDGAFERRKDRGPRPPGLKCLRGGE